VVPLVEPEVLSGEGDAPGGLREASVPAVPLPVVSLGRGVTAAVEDGLEVLSAELAGGVADTLLSLRREHAATEPASATAISATSKGFAELRCGRLAKFDFMINLHLSERVGHFWRVPISENDAAWHGIGKTRRLHRKSMPEILH
jgi:hypothetical protein